MSAIEGVGPKRAGLLGNLGVATVRDLLFHFPKRYEDRSFPTPISDLEEGQDATIVAEVVRARNVRLRRRMTLCQATLRDDSGETSAVWFGQGYLARRFQPGQRGVFHGAVGAYKGLVLRNPEFELFEPGGEAVTDGRLTPVYKLAERLSQRMLRQWIASALETLADGGAFRDPLPAALASERGFMDAVAALESAHFPRSVNEAREARARFAYTELLAMQIGALRRRAEESQTAHGRRGRVDGPKLRALSEALPFRLTEGQRRAVHAILADMEAPRPMSRLLQGDVGCGKTAVALHAIAAAADSGCQTAVMAPTEILAEQHALSLRRQLEPLGIRTGRLTGSAAGASHTRARSAAGDLDVIAGTHALLSETTAFHDLGLVIVDEQHRFGVLQREELTAKGLEPDVLHMTATPIPRSLALTAYGHMDLTLIDELPPGRRPVRTRRVSPKDLERVYKRIRRNAAKGEQAYIVCPLVEDSEAVELSAVLSRHAELSAAPLQALRTGVLHGRLPPDEKEAVMASFREGELDVLVCTSVVEVGVDVPAATVMVIEDAAQFGLTQLHQLRGRIGRSDTEARCYLAGKPKTAEGRKRLDILCSTSSGFDIAEADLDMRGPGEFRGVRQAGLSDLRVADLVRDVHLLSQARQDAEALLARDPMLREPEHAALLAASGSFRDVLL